MATMITFDGLAQLVADMNGLGAELAERAKPITRAVAEQVAADIRNIYPEHTGNLRAGVRVSQGRGAGLFVSAVVRSTAPHAHLYEYGTASRTFGTQDRGQMFVRNPAAKTAGRTDRPIRTSQPSTSSVSGHPAMPVVGARAAMGRVRLNDELKAMVKRVTGAELVERIDG